MDGVVIDSEKLHLRALSLTLEKNGITYPEEILPSFAGKSDRFFFEYVRDHFAVDGRVDIDEFLSEKDELFNSLIPRIELVDGFEHVIRQVKALGIKTALVTSSSWGTVDRVDELLDIKRWFDTIIAEEDTMKHKPHPAPYLLALERLNAKKDSTIIIEDSTVGIAAGKAAGCVVFGLTTSFDKQTLLEAGANYAFDTYEEVAFAFSCPL